MSDAPADFSRLSPEELRRLAREHTEALFAELKGAWAHAREHYAPVEVARKHPVATAAAAAAAGLLLARAVRRRAASAAAPEPRQGLKGAVLGLAGAAATRLLPRLLDAALARRQEEKP